MKKYFYIFLGISILSALYFIFPVKNTSEFVKLNERSFILNDKPLYPLVINFMSSFQFDGNNLWVSSYKGYNPSSKFLYNNKDSAQIQLRADMSEIKSMGFNTVRIVGVGEPWLDEEKEILSISAGVSSDKDTTIKLSNDSLIDIYLNALENLFTIVEESGLKTIFLIKLKPYSISSEYLLKKFCMRFKNTECILAIDIFNEPLYFDKPEKKKKEVFEIVNNWRSIIKMYAPNHLVTIGLEGIREVFRWDPNILNVDFISYHPYEYEPEQVRNEVYWYGKYTEIPWIIGETAIPADNDSISYAEQKEFANKTLNQVANCGGSGYSWWQYKDVDWQYFHADYMGILNRNGWSKSKKYNIPIYGEQKPIVDEFINYEYTINQDSCMCLENYYNYSQSTIFKLVGTIKNTKGEPIEGGVVLAWNENWTHSYHTISKKDGSFVLLGSYPFYHWMASATKLTMVRGDINPEDAIKEDGRSIPSINLGEIIIEPLDFLN